jgi:uncharacterized protein with FMN-binding domain
MIALCSVAVGVAYVSGYIVTEKQAQPSVQPALKQVALHVPAIPAKPQEKVRTTNAQVSKKSPYKDGIYTGSSANELGNLSVSVSIQNGKIANVEITNYDMHYSQSNIDPQMIQETVRQQNTHIDGVSGATASSDNFVAAVHNALGKAAV